MPKECVPVDAIFENSIESLSNLNSITLSSPSPVTISSHSTPASFRKDWKSWTLSRLIISDDNRFTSILGP
jgi:hypothetical protein